MTGLDSIGVKARFAGVSPMRTADSPVGDVSPRDGRWFAHPLRRTVETNTGNPADHLKWRMPQGCRDWAETANDLLLIYCLPAAIGGVATGDWRLGRIERWTDRKSTRLNS